MGSNSMSTLYMHIVVHIVFYCYMMCVCRISKKITYILTYFPIGDSGTSRTSSGYSHASRSDAVYKWELETIVLGMPITSEAAAE